MASLYDIDNRLKMLEEWMVDIETGEIVDEEEFAMKFDEIQMALNDKIENTICYIKCLNSDIEAFKNEEKSLAQRRKYKENLAERLQSRIDTYIRNQYTDEYGNVNIEDLNKYKFETPKMKIAYRKSDSVDILDIDKIPSTFIKIETKKSPIKNDIKRAIKNGMSIEGATLTTNVNMQIK